MEISTILGRLRHTRKTCGMKQESIAAELGYGRTNYVKKEKGEIPITTDEWIKLASILNTPLDYFFRDSIETYLPTPKFTTEETIYVQKLLAILRNTSALNSDLRENIKKRIDMFFNLIQPQGILKRIEMGFKDLLVAEKQAVYKKKKAS